MFKPFLNSVMVLGLWGKNNNLHWYHEEVEVKGFSSESTDCYNWTHFLKQIKETVVLTFLFWRFSFFTYSKQCKNIADIILCSTWAENTKHTIVSHVFVDHTRHSQWGKCWMKPLFTYVLVLFHQGKLYKVEITGSTKKQDYGIN